MVMNVKSQKKANLFDRSNPIAIISFLTTLRLACNTSHIYEKTTMLVLQNLKKNTTASTPKSRISAAMDSTPEAASVNTVKKNPGGGAGGG